MNRKFRKLVTIIIPFIIVIWLGIYIGYIFLDTFSVKNTKVLVNQGESVYYMVYKGGLSSIINHKLIFYYAIKLFNIDKRIVPGVYNLPSKSNLITILLELKNGKPNFISFTIVRGETFSQIKNKVDNLPNIIHITANSTEAEITDMMNIDYSGSKLEGLLAPDTYYLSPNQTDLEFYIRAYHKMWQHFFLILQDYSLTAFNNWWNYQLLYSRQLFDYKIFPPLFYYEQLPYDSFYQILIMASLIEKETGDAEDMRKVAAVFINRLNKNMFLQDDPAVFYGLNYKAKITRADFKVNTPYNTYLHKGLPPSPIATVSDLAIIASVNPFPDRNLLFFIADKNSNTIFANNYHQHQHNIKLLKHSTIKSTRHQVVKI